MKPLSSFVVAVLVIVAAIAAILVADYYFGRWRAKREKKPPLSLVDDGESMADLVRRIHEGNFAAPVSCVGSASNKPAAPFDTDNSEIDKKEEECRRFRARHIQLFYNGMRHGVVRPDLLEFVDIPECLPTDSEEGRAPLNYTQLWTGLRRWSLISEDEAHVRGWHFTPEWIQRNELVGGSWIQNSLGDVPKRDDVSYTYARERAPFFLVESSDNSFVAAFDRGRYNRLYRQNVMHFVNGRPGEFWTVDPDPSLASLEDMRLDWASAFHGFFERPCREMPHGT